MIPVFVLTDGVELPNEGNYYVVTADGVFLHKETGLITATVRVGGIPFLEKIPAAARLHIPKLPSTIVAQTWLFFRRIHKRMNSEAIVLLHYSVETGQYLLHCPEQKVSAGGLDYDPSERFEGYQLVGSIHSHNTFDAFHSGVDTHDEMDFDGLHITIGKLDKPFFTISCSVVVNNNRFPMTPEAVTESVVPVEWKPKPKIVYVRKPKVAAKPKANGVLGTVANLFIGTPEEPVERVEIPDKNQYYDLALPDGQTFRNIRFPRTWYDRVQPKVVQQAPVGVGATTVPSVLPTGEGDLAWEEMVALFGGFTGGEYEL